MASGRELGGGARSGARGEFEAGPVGGGLPCAICAGTGQDPRRLVHLTHGVVVWLCEAHAGKRLLREDDGAVVAESLASIAVERGREGSAHCVTSLGPGRARARLAELAGHASEIDTSDLLRLARDDDPDVRVAARRSQAEIDARPRPPIRIITLGGLKVWRGEALVPDTAFKRRKARALLGALLCAGSPVHRDLLLEWFWPDLPPARSLAALNVTLHDLRRGLEPGLARGAASSLVAVDGKSYRIALAAGDVWDAAAFLALAAAPRSGATREVELIRLMEAERTHTGPLLPEWSYEPWSEELRARVEEVHLGTLERLAAALLEADRAPEALTRYRRLLALDPEREAWHRGLMNAYAKSGELALALRQYHSCRAQLRRGQGTEPSAETRALYSRLLTAGGAGDNTL